MILALAIIGLIMACVALGVAFAAWLETHR